MKTCPFYLTLASLWLDDLDRLPAVIGRHVRRCPACRGHLEREVRLTQDLQTAAVVGRAPLPESFPLRFPANHRGPSAVAEPLLSPARQWRWLALAGAGATALLVVWLALSVATPTPPRPDVVTLTRPVPDPRVAVQRLVPRGGESLAGWSQLLAQPLNREIDSALEDSRGALLTLVENFVPEPNIAIVTARANGLFPELNPSVTAEP